MHARQRQGTKRLISFSLWGDNPLYVEGAVKNVELRDQFYPGWVCRFYIDRETTPQDCITALQGMSDVELCFMSHVPDVLGMYWRFRPMFDDSEVERFIVRDTDSKLSEREAVAVQEWIDSNLPFHIMRDCESHGIPILGGTWGALPGCVELFWEKMSSWLSVLKPLPENPRGLFHGSDQLFLAKYIWPEIKERHVAHIREGMEQLRFSPSDRYFPTALPEDGHYIGAVW